MAYMQIPAPIHGWDVTPTEAVGIQKELRSRLRTDIPLALDNVRYVAGVDVSMTKDNPTLTAGIVLWDRTDGTILETASVQTPATFPYVPGLLSFREIPALLQAVAMLTNEPDVWLVDGHGIAHPRRLGIAAHFGLLIDRPTIGVAKSRLTGKFEEPMLAAGSRSDLMDHDEQIGVVYRSKLKSNPLFLSPGNRIDLPSAVKIVEVCLRGYRLPEPTRLAHLHVNSVRTGEGGLMPVQKQPSLL
jgi:deoxyribonuclease V